jgi:hypothetical protein
VKVGTVKFFNAEAVRFFMNEVRECLTREKRERQKRRSK